MKRLRLLPVLVSLLMMSTFIFLSADATTPANIDPGDTFIYSVSTWDVPWEELIPPEEAPFDLADFVLDLSGSTLGVKVMDTYANGYYMLDFYVVLGKTIVIPLPDDTDPQVIDIFGTEFTLDEGVGLGLGSYPGSDMTELIAGTEESFGLPFYFNPADWSIYQTQFEALETADLSVDVTNTAGSDFDVTFSGTADGVSISLSASWFREGDNAGVFKSISGTIDGDITGDGTSNHLGIELSFDSKQVNPLPTQVRNKDDMTLSLSTADLTYEVDGLSTSVNAEISSQLAAAEAFLGAYEGVDVITFDVEDTAGCYYNTRIEVYNSETDMMEQVVDELWWNGFTGYPVMDQTDYFFSDMPYTPWSSSFGLVPLLAPGITPDWDMWAASTVSISEVNEIVEKSIEAFFKEEEVKDLGLDLNTLDSVYQLRESGDGSTMFFYSETGLDLVWNAGQMEGAAQMGLPADTQLSIEFSSNSWLAYTKAGLLAGAGVEVSVVVEAKNIPGTAGEFETGSITVDANIAIQSDLVSSIPDPEDADPIAGGNAGGGDLIPGFELVTSLMVMTTIVAIINKKRK